MFQPAMLVGLPEGTKNDAFRTCIPPASTMFRHFKGTVSIREISTANDQNQKPKPRQRSTALWFHLDGLFDVRSGILPRCLHHECIAGPFVTT